MTSEVISGIPLPVGLRVTAERSLSDTAGRKQHVRYTREASSFTFVRFLPVFSSEPRSAAGGDVSVRAVAKQVHEREVRERDNMVSCIFICVSCS